MLKIILKIIEWLAFAGILILLFIVISPVLPFNNFAKSFIVVSGSMEPSIKTGSIAITRPIPPSQIKKGDIVAFTSPDNPKNTILHRIDSVKSTDPLIFLTKGDNNNAPDSWEVSSIAVIGSYVYSIPYLGNAASFIRQPLGFVLMIVVPALLFIFFQIFNINRAIDYEVNKKIEEKNRQNNFFSILIIALSLSSIIATSPIKNVNAFFSDTSQISGINLTTIIPTPTPTITPTATPTPKPTGYHCRFRDWHCNFGHHWFKDKFRAFLRKNHQYVKFHFYNFPKFGPKDYLNYELVYRSHDLEKGISGSFDLKNNSNLEIEQFLGTCSGTDCTPDFKSITSVTLSIKGEINSEAIELEGPVDFE